MKLPFAYLNVHSVYSIQNSFIEPHGYVKAIQRYHQQKDSRYEIKALALTEDGFFNSQIKLYEACQGTEIKAIYGVDLYVCDSTSLEPAYRLTLIAKNNKGLENLNQITSHGGMNRQISDKQIIPMVEFEFMKGHGEGIIALSSGLSSCLAPFILGNRITPAIQRIQEMKTIFDAFYLEIHPHDIPDQLILNRRMKELSEKTSTPMVITTQSYYLNKEEADYHSILRQMGGLEPYPTCHDLKTPEELEAYCLEHRLPLECLTQTAQIAQECEVHLMPSSNRAYLPQFKVPLGYDEESYLRYLTNQALKEWRNQYPNQPIKHYLNRLNYELDVISQTGFSGYFLILWDWIRWCRSQNIVIGPGRGSAAGSLVAYLLKITNVDPIKHNLIFERFMNPERVSFPDIDVDVDSRKRSLAIGYFIQTYGEEHVCQIITYSKYNLKNTLQKVNTSFKFLPPENLTKLTKSIPGTIGEESTTFELLRAVALGEQDNSELKENEIQRCQKVYEKLEALFSEYPEFYQAVYKLKGAIASIGLHAGGVVVSRVPLTSHFPMLKGKAETAVLPIIQLEMSDLELLHVLKIDALGLSNLSTIQHAMQLAGLGWNWFDNEDATDEKVFQMLRRGQTTDVFQMMKYQPTKMIRDFKVNSLEGLVIVNGGNRPGPLAVIEGIGKSMVDLYVEGLNNPASIPCYHPKIDAILKDTHGCIWWQEQLMAIGQVMAGYSLGNADTRIRKTIAKKKRHLLEEIKIEFVYGKKPLFNEEGHIIGISDEPSPYCEGAIAKGFSKELALNIFDIMEKFGSYGFNRSHSLSYAFLAYKTAWLSCYYPVEYAIACLTQAEGDTDKLLATLTLCRKRNIKILPPSLNHSNGSFTLEYVGNQKAIRFGLMAIKGVSHSTVRYILACRQKTGMIQSLDDYFHIYQGEVGKEIRYQLKINTNPIDTGVEKKLILCGAFDEIHSNRYFLLNEISTKYRQIKDYKPYKIEEYSLKVALELETELLTTFVSQHPLESYPYVDLSQLERNQKVTITGTLIHFENAKQRNGEAYCAAKLELKDGSVWRLNLFGQTFKTYRPQLVKKKVYIVTGMFQTTYKSLNVYELEKIEL